METEWVGSRPSLRLAELLGLELQVELQSSVGLQRWLELEHRLKLDLALQGVLGQQGAREVPAERRAVAEHGLGLGHQQQQR